jgi:hypothetical protein
MSLLLSNKHGDANLLHCRNIRENANAEAADGKLLCRWLGGERRLD